MPCTSCSKHCVEMYFFFGISVVFLAPALILDFIAVTTADWFAFKTKSDLSLTVQWSGLYRSCSYPDNCVFDLWQRPLVGQINFFFMVSSIVIIFIALTLLIAAEHQARKDLFITSACFAIFGGAVIIASMIMYTIAVERELRGIRYTALGSYGSSYIIAWVAALLCVLAGICALLRMWRLNKGVAPCTQAPDDKNEKKNSNEENEAEAFV
ncbi:uncharacterized protein LOC143471088 [Clavelina lepadiformis]|uniref:uncharacterized protein LOC143471088 n=1 Tax=Clavelina lepadiformis TaxID=159417 RepID=UPI0040413434